ncbi:reverse transcriptase [Plakobranchus ocellatus]|uniref:Reverse transcriptase n=1 Tax=Plakobranchus ocellatus TaxID=259542 RepID=A0AAV4DBM5_9GAST|nr:reverse transcriptase [Plakobranchus ocellatus]
MGCTISPNLFVLAMEVITRAGKGSTIPAEFGDGSYMLPLKALKDDTTILCSKENDTFEDLFISVEVPRAWTLRGGAYWMDVMTGNFQLISPNGPNILDKHRVSYESRIEDAIEEKNTRA